MRGPAVLALAGTLVLLPQAAVAVTPVVPDPGAVTSPAPVPAPSTAQAPAPSTAVFPQPVAAEPAATTTPSPSPKPTTAATPAPRTTPGRPAASPVTSASPPPSPAPATGLPPRLVLPPGTVLPPPDDVVDALASLTAAQQALPIAREQLAAARRSLTAAQATQKQAEKDLAAAETEQQRSAAVLARIRVALTGAREDAGRLARETYMSGPGTAQGGLAVALGAATPRQFLDGIYVTNSVAHRQQDRIDDLEDRRSSLLREETSLAASRTRAATARTQAQQAVGDQKVLVAQATEAERRVVELVRQRTEAVAIAESTKRTDEGRYAELDAEDARLLAQLAAGLGAGAAAAVPGSGLLIPAGGRQSSPFGMRTHPITGEFKLHTGLDIAAPCGTPIRAAQAGTVLLADYSRGYGYRTVVDHGTVGGVRLTTTYNHQQVMAVVPGDRVARGQVLGAVGTTGYSTGCHLHFEVLADGAFVDPAPYL